jgi:hypothetical protein
LGANLPLLYSIIKRSDNRKMSNQNKIVTADLSSETHKTICPKRPMSKIQETCASHPNPLTLVEDQKSKIRKTQLIRTLRTGILSMKNTIMSNALKSKDGSSHPLKNCPMSKIMKTILLIPVFTGESRLPYPGIRFFLRLLYQEARIELPGTYCLVYATCKSGRDRQLN